MNPLENNLPKKKGLLLVAHGSRSATSNQEIHALVVQIRDTIRNTTHANPTFDLIEPAFLEIAEPTIAEGGNKLIASGATEIIVLPHFLAAGNHVNKDLPAAAALLQAQHPSIPITITPHIGNATDIPQLVCDHLQQLKDVSS